MPFVDRANYPIGIPDAAFHLDTDDVDDYRLPCTIGTDYILYQDLDTAMPPVLQWYIRTSARGTPTLLMNDPANHTKDVAKDCRVRDQGAEIQRLQAQIAVMPTPVVAVPPTPRVNSRLGTPHTFTGITNDKGIYDPTPQDFVRNVRNYIFVQERQTGTRLSDVDHILMISTFLDQSAAMWYEQEVHKLGVWEREVALDPTLIYTGAMLNVDRFTDTLLKQFEDIDIKKTAIPKISTIVQGTNSAEVHVRLFKDWAQYTEFNDTTLIEFFKKSLKLALLDKVNGQGKHVPETLEG